VPISCLIVGGVFEGVNELPEHGNHGLIISLKPQYR